MRLKLLAIFLFVSCSPVHATLYDSDKQSVFAKTILDNGGFESGKAGWTASGGTFTTVTSGTNLLTGLVSATWDSGSASQTLSFKSVTIPKGLYGKNGVGVCKIQVPSGTATHTLQVTDGSSILVSTTITSSTLPTYNFSNFIVPSSGSLVIRIVSVASDEPLIAIDDCWLGDAAEINLTNISQAQFVGSAYYETTASCAWTRANTSLGAFGTDAQCPGPTVEIQSTSDCTIQTTDNDLPQITLNNCGPGIYTVIAQGYFGASTGMYQAFALNDGTTSSGQTVGFEDSNTSNNRTIAGTFSYTTAGNRTFAIFARSDTGTITLANEDNLKRTVFRVYRHPLSSEQGFKADQSASSWSGYHDSTCSWARTNTAYGDPTADATCSLTERLNSNFGTVTTYTVTNAEPGIVFTPTKVQRYWVCALPVVNSNNINVGVRLWDGTTTIAETSLAFTSTAYVVAPLCGIYNATSTSAVTLSIQTKSASGSVTITQINSGSSVEWSIFAINQSLPAPLLVNSVTNSSSGVTRVEAANLNCDAGSAITSQLGSWISSIGNIASGNCTVTLNSGIFSAAPHCTVSQITTTDRQFMRVSVASATSVTFGCDNDGGADCTTVDAHLICVGAH